MFYQETAELLNQLSSSFYLIFINIYIEHFEGENNFQNRLKKYLNFWSNKNRLEATKNRNPLLTIPYQKFHTLHLSIPNHVN